MSTETMLTTLKAYPGTEARAPSLHAWVCYREGDVCHIQIATVETVGDTTVNKAFPVVPMRDDWEVFTP